MKSWGYKSFPQIKKNHPQFLCFTKCLISLQIHELLPKVSLWIIRIYIFFHFCQKSLCTGVWMRVKRVALRLLHLLLHQLLVFLIVPSVVRSSSPRRAARSTWSAVLQIWTSHRLCWYRLCRDKLRKPRVLPLLIYCKSDDNFVA